MSTPMSNSTHLACAGYNTDARQSVGDFIIHMDTPKNDCILNNRKHFDGLVKERRSSGALAMELQIFFLLTHWFRLFANCSTLITNKFTCLRLNFHGFTIACYNWLFPLWTDSHCSALGHYWFNLRNHIWSLSAIYIIMLLISMTAAIR